MFSDLLFVSKKQPQDDPPTPKSAKIQGFCDYDEDKTEKVEICETEQPE